jgi:ligand-binding sensor domain-containing protein/signal transduction histidine kinase
MRISVNRAGWLIERVFSKTVDSHLFDSTAGTTVHAPDMQISKLKCLLILLVAFIVPGHAATLVPSTGIPGYTKRLWGPEDGLPDQTIQAFAQTPDGSLWIATKEGLVRFDGQHFAAYTRETGPAFLERGINCLFTAHDGSLWIGTEGGGLFRYRGGTFQSYPARDGLTNEFIRSIYQDQRGTVWVGSDQGLFQVVGSSMARIDNRNGIPSIFVRAITGDSTGHVWVGGTALLEFDRGSLVKQYPLPGGPSRNLIISAFVARDGTLWLGTLSGLHRFSRSLVLDRLPGIAAQVSALYESSDGTLWAGTNGDGLFSWRDGHLTHIPPANLVSQSIQAVFEDREHNIWLGTHAGMIRLSRTPVDIISFPGRADSEFGALYRDTDNSIWIAVSSHLFRIVHDVATPWTFSALPDLRVRTLLRDRDGNLWLGTDGSGLVELSGKTIRKFSVGNGLINDFVRVILQSRDGSLWVGTDGGISHLANGSIHNFDTAHGLAYFSVTSLLEDRDGDLWIGTSRGLSHRSHGVYVRDAATAAMSQEQLWSICQDSQGEIWFGTSNGLYGFASGKLVHLTTRQGLATNSIYQILDDHRGNLWLSGPNSVSRLSIGDLDAFAHGVRSSAHLTFFVDSHDLNSASLYGGLQPEGAVTPNGDIWLPANQGAVHIAVDRIVPDDLSPVAINEVNANGQQMPLDRCVVLGADNSRLEITYGAIRLRSQEALRYRYRMEGMEGWTEAFGRRTAYYTHLPPGTYRFRVQTFAIDNPDAVSEASIEIVQRPHIYATIWFLGCCGLVLSGLVFVIYRLRLQQMRRQFHAVGEERARLAREMHDTVIQGCVGVSTLLEAALEVEPAEEPLRQHLLTYATEQIRATIEAAREAVWALRNPSTSEKDPASLAQRTAHEFQTNFGIPIGCTVSGVPFHLGDSATHELMMTVRETLANAVTHAHATRIEMSTSFLEHELTINIRDDGCGFDPQTKLAQNGHYGIVGMQERMRLLGGAVEIDSAPGRGACVRIRVPRRAPE